MSTASGSANRVGSRLAAGKQDQDTFSGGDLSPGEGDLVADPAMKHLGRALVAQRFLDGARGQGRPGRPPGASVAPDCGSASARRRRSSRSSSRPANSISMHIALISSLLSPAHGPAASRLGDHVGPGCAAAQGEQPVEIFRHLKRPGVSVRADRPRRSRRRRGRARLNEPRPGSAHILTRHAEHLRDHGRGQRIGEAGDQLRAAPLDEIIEKLVDDLVNAVR